MRSRAVFATALLAGSFCLLAGCAAKVRDMSMPEGKIGLRYRVELFDVKKAKWDVIETNRAIEKTQDVRFRFMSNVDGTLYVLNSSDPMRSLKPISDQGEGSGLRQYLGLGTHIGANEVGIFPDPENKKAGGGMRFSGVRGKERFLMVFVPDHLGKRDVVAIPAGAEGWDFEAETTHMAIGEPSHMLFHYIEINSR